MTERTVKVRYAAVIDPYISGVKRMQAETDSFAKRTAEQASKNEDTWKAVSTAMIGTGLAISAGLLVAANRFADFDQAMSAVRANVRTVGSELDDLRALAIQMGADTQYSATEAAQAINEMGKAGVDAKDILGGGLKGALDLAASGQLSVARAAEIAATTMNQFGLAGKDIGHVADLLAAAANKAQGSVDDVAQALKYVGPVAKSMGISLEETVGVIGEFASKGIIGEQAGTAFRGMLLSLTSPSRAAAEAMAKYGISVYDSSGRLKSMADIAASLRTGLGQLDQATRNEALGRIFGNEQMTAAIALYEGGGDAVRQWTKDVNDAGFAARQAATLTDNLRGDIERLGGSIDTALIKSGSGANSALRSIAQAAESAVNAFGDLPDGVQTTVVGFAAVTAGALLVGGGMIKLSAQVKLAQARMVELGITSQATGAKMASALGKGFAVAAVAETSVALQGMAASAQVATPAVSELSKALGAMGKGNEGKAFRDLFSRGVGPFKKEFADAAEAIRDFGANAKAALDPEWYETAMGTANEAASVYNTRIRQIDAALVEMVKSGKTAEAAQMVDALANSTKQFGGNADKVRESLTGYKAALEGTSSTTQTATSATQDYAGTLEDQKRASERATQAVDDARRALLDYGSALSGAINAQMGWEQAVDGASESLKRNGKTLDLGTEKGRNNMAALLEMADAAKKNAVAMIENKVANDQVNTTMDTSRQKFVDQAVAMGMSRKKAEEMATQLGLTRDNVGKLTTAIEQANKTTLVIQADTVEAQTRISAIQTMLNNLKAKPVVVPVTYETYGAGLYSNKPIAEIPGHATGGRLVGPGTGTSDSILIRASNGEGIVTADAMAYYERQHGRHWIDSINAKRFATGGRVGGASTVNSTVSLPADGWSLTGKVDIGGMVVDLVDARLSRVGARAGVREF